MKEIWVVGISYGELVLKGKNRQRFIEKAERQIARLSAPFHVRKAFTQQGKYFLEVEGSEVEGLCQALQKAFGVIYITPALRVAKTPEALTEAAIFLLSRRADESEVRTFKVETKRSDKSFPLSSPQISAEIGGRLLDVFAAKGWRVDVHEPAVVVQIEIREDAFVSIERYRGIGGLPMGSGGRGLLLLSGGIDSPVAGFAMARRGVALGAVHFHSYPFTGERAKEKAVRLAQTMSERVGPMRLYMINLLETYTSIHQNCHSKNTTLLSRRMMMRVADALSDRYEYDALITGESLGQVASQTIQGLSVINEVARHPILRPLLAMDKVQIMEWARAIDTYEISIEPYDDCCSVFAPTRPNTKPRLSDLLKEESKLDVEGLLAQALDSLEIVDID